MDAFSVRTKIMIGGGMDALAQRLHRVFLVTDKFMDESGKTNYVTDRLPVSYTHLTLPTT